MRSNFIWDFDKRYFGEREDGDEKVLGSRGPSTWIEGEESYLGVFFGVCELPERQEMWLNFWSCFQCLELESL